MAAEVTIDGKKYRIPLGAGEITLGQRIDFDALYGDALAKRVKQILDMKDLTLKELEFGEYHLDLACKSLSFFAQIPLEVVRNTSIYEVLEVWKTILDTVGDDLNFQDPDRPIVFRHEWADRVWRIYPPEVKQDSQITFGEFLDGKQVVKNLYELGTAKWQAMLPLCCIYLRPEMPDGSLEPYDEKLPNEDGERWKLFRNLPLSIAYEVGFFERNSQYLQDAFPVFGPSRIKGGRQVAKHLDGWSWVNFLKEIAKTKIFDIHGGGMNSIQAARAAKLFDVLVYSSEEKLMNEAVYLDQEAEMKNMVNSLDELQIYGDKGLFHQLVMLSKILAGRYYPVAVGNEVNKNNLGTWIDEEKPTWPAVVCLPPISQLPDIDKQVSRETYTFRLFFLCRDGYDGENAPKAPDPVTGIPSHTTIEDMADMKKLAVTFLVALNNFVKNTKGRYGFLDPESIPVFDRVRNLSSAGVNGVALTIKFASFTPCDFTDIDMTILDSRLVDNIPVHPDHFH